MEIYDSEKEQVEALKRWWKENGRMVVLGLVIGLGGTFGWNGWQSWRNTQAENASLTYQSLLAAAAQSDVEQVNSRGMALLNDYPESGYAPLAALVMAKSAVTEERADDAGRHLQWALEHATETGIKQIAQLRLARLAAARKDFDGALTMLRQVTLAELMAAVDELRGDIAVEREEPDTARAAYAKALEADGLPDDVRARIGIKLDDLGHYNMPPEPAS